MQAIPYTVSALPAAAVQIAAGSISSYALLNDGTVWAWGWNADGQLGDGTTVDRLSPVVIGNYGTDTGMQLSQGSAVRALLDSPSYVATHLAVNSSVLVGADG